MNVDRIVRCGSPSCPCATRPDEELSDNKTNNKQAETTYHSPAKFIKEFDNAFGFRPGHTEDLDMWTNRFINLATFVIQDSGDRNIKALTASLAGLTVLLYSVADYAQINLDEAIVMMKETLVSEQNKKNNDDLLGALAKYFGNIEGRGFAFNLNDPNVKISTTND